MATSFSIVWLDANSSDPSSSFLVKLGNVESFTQPADCISYIQSHHNQSIFLIVSGSLAEQVVSHVFDFSHVIQIFVFCGSIGKYAEWAVDYCEKLMMFDHQDDLLQRLWNDLHIHLREQANDCLKRADEFKLRALRFKQPACG